MRCRCQYKLGSAHIAVPKRKTEGESFESGDDPFQEFGIREYDFDEDALVGNCFEEVEEDQAAMRVVMTEEEKNAQAILSVASSLKGEEFGVSVAELQNYIKSGTAGFNI